MHREQLWNAFYNVKLHEIPNCQTLEENQNIFKKKKKSSLL